MASERASDGVLHDGAPALDVGAYGAVAQARLQAVAVAVQSDLVPGRSDLGRQLRPALHLLADQEERRHRPGLGQRGEHRRGSLRVGSVIEREGHPRSARQRARHPEDGRAAGINGREGMSDHSHGRPIIAHPGAGRVARCATTERAVVAPDLDSWLDRPSIRVSHRRASSAAAPDLWQAAQQVRLSDTQVLGRLIRWRIPGLPRDLAFDQLFRQPPFMVLQEDEHCLVSGLVGRIWTLRRDYPQLGSAQEFLEWSTSGTARVVIANWITTDERDESRCALAAEARVQSIGAQGRMGVAGVRPLVRTFGYLVGSEGIGTAVRRAERR